MPTHRILSVLRTLAVVLFGAGVLSALAATWRDDFTHEKDFIGDTKVGVWSEDVTNFAWDNGSILAQNHNPNLTFILVTGDFAFRDYSLESRIQFLTPGSAGLIFRRPCLGQGCAPAYLGHITDFAWFRAQEASIWRQNNWTKLDGKPFTPQLNVWYVLKAVITGDDFEFFIDGVSMAKAVDVANPAGKAGLYFYDARVRFDDFILTGPEVPDGGHWDPSQHDARAVSPREKVTATWSRLKRFAE